MLQVTPTPRLVLEFRRVLRHRRYERPALWTLVHYRFTRDGRGRGSGGRSGPVRGSNSVEFCFFSTARSGGTRGLERCGGGAGGGLGRSGRRGGLTRPVGRTCRGGGSRAKKRTRGRTRTSGGGRASRPVRRRWRGFSSRAGPGGRRTDDYRPTRCSSGLGRWRCRRACVGRSLCVGPSRGRGGLRSFRCAGTSGARGSCRPRRFRRGGCGSSAGACTFCGRGRRGCARSGYTLAGGGACGGASALRGRSARQGGG